MNEKQAKLLRYFEKYSGDVALVKQIRKGWKYIPAKRKGKLTAWLKKVIVTMMHVKNEREKWEARKREIQQAANMKVLGGFA